MQSIEAGLCGPKLRSAPEISEGDDAAHILYCPECAARLRLVGVTPIEAAQVVAPKVTSRETLSDFLGAVEAKAHAPIAVDVESGEAVAPPDEAPSEDSGAVEPAIAVAVDADFAVDAAADVAADVAQAVDAAQAVEVPVKVAADFDDDEPTRILSNADVPEDAREALGNDTITSIDVELPTPIVPALKLAAADETPEQIVKIALESLNSEPNQPLLRPAMSDAPIAVDVTILPQRTKAMNYRRLAFGAVAAVLVVSAGLVLRGHGQKEPSQDSTVAASMPQPKALAAAAIQEPEVRNVAAESNLPQPTPLPAGAAVEVEKSNSTSRSGKKTALSTASRADNATGNLVASGPKSEAPPAEAEPKSKLDAFDAEAAASALNSAASRASACRKPTDPSGVAVVTVSFAPSGRVTSATISGPPFVGTATGSCIAATLRKARMPAFSGSLKTVKKTLTIQ